MTPYYQDEFCTLYLCDCMALMAGCRDKEFDLAICDPPYNVGASDGLFGAGPGSYRYDLKHYANYDSVPDKNYFAQLFRICQNQIIWGMNYYPEYLYHSGAIIWDKKLTGSPLSDCEIAFQSINKLVLKCESEWNGFLKGGDTSKRIHPNQKPIQLYRWLLQKYTKPSNTIFDSHLGSGSIAIACHDLGFHLTGCEIDESYLSSAVNRIKNYLKQPKLFKPYKNMEQENLFGDNL